MSESDIHQFIFIWIFKVCKIYNITWSRHMISLGGFSRIPVFLENFHCWDSCSNDVKVRGGEFALDLYLFIIQYFSGFGKCNFQQSVGVKSKIFFLLQIMVGAAGNSVKSRSFEYTTVTCLMKNSMSGKLYLLASLKLRCTSVSYRLSIYN